MIWIRSKIPVPWKILTVIKEIILSELNGHEQKDFKGLSKKDLDETIFPNGVECPVCLGHGGWIIKRDAYGKGKHFQACCSQCNGWGWIKKGSLDETCFPHDMEELTYQECQKIKVQHFGNCYHVYRCKKCGQIVSHDSSD